MTVFFGPLGIPIYNKDGETLTFKPWLMSAILRAISVARYTFSHFWRSIPERCEMQQWAKIKVVPGRSRPHQSPIITPLHTYSKTCYYTSGDFLLCSYPSVLCLGLHFGSKKDWISRLILKNYRYFTGVFRTKVKPCYVLLKQPKTSLYPPPPPETLLREDSFVTYSKCLDKWRANEVV